MRRLLGLLIGAALAASTLVVLPAVSWSADPEEIDPDGQSIKVSGVDQDALPQTQEPVVGEHDHPDGTSHGPMEGDADALPEEQKQPVDLEPEVVTPEIATEEFGLVGVTFDEAPPTGATVQVRVRRDDGWSEWNSLPVDAHIPDPEDEQVRPGTDPLLTDPADGVQVRIDAPKGTDIPSANVETVEIEEAPADAGIINPGPASRATAAVARPNIITRAQWGAKESLRGGCPGYTDAHKVAFVHHTAGYTNYGPTGGPAEMRSVYKYTIQSRGYCDFPYNMAVDKYGNIYEGRAGGVDQPVKSGATLSFNGSSMSIVVLGTFTNTPSVGFSKINTALGKILGWKLALTGRSSLATEAIATTSSSGGYPTGTMVTFDRISGHRDANNTSCPGDALYTQLPTIRTIAANYQKSGGGVAEPGKLATYITQWSQSRREGLKNTYYRSGFRVSPAGVHTVQIKRRTSAGTSVHKTLTTDSNGYAPFSLKFYSGEQAYKLKVLGTEDTLRSTNGWMTMVGVSRLNTTISGWPKAKSSVSRSKKRTVRVRVTPGGSRQFVVRKNRGGRKWNTKPAWTDSNGYVTLTFKAKRFGKKFKFKVLASDQAKGKKTPWLYIRRG